MLFNLNLWQYIFIGFITTTISFIPFWLFEKYNYKYLNKNLVIGPFVFCLSYMFFGVKQLLMTDYPQSNIDQVIDINCSFALWYFLILLLYPNNYKTFFIGFFISGTYLAFVTYLSIRFGEQITKGDSFVLSCILIVLYTITLPFFKRFTFSLRLLKRVF